MKTVTISTKEIRDDLEGFLRRLKEGQTLQVMFRSKPIVTVAAKDTGDAYLAPDAGTPAAAKRSAKFAHELSKRPVILDPRKSFKELYDETRPL